MEKDTSSKLIETATLLFAKKGFAAVSIRELAQAAQVNSALISYHFRGKEGLYLAVLEEQFQPIAEALLMLENMTHLSATERLTLYAKQVAAIHHQRSFLTLFLNSELSTPTPGYEKVLKKYIYRLFRFIRTALADGVANGDFNANLNLDYTTVSLAGIMNFYFIVKPMFREFAPLPGQSDEEYTTQAITIYLNGIIRRREYE